MHSEDICCAAKQTDRLGTQKWIKVSAANKSAPFDPFSSSVFGSFSSFSHRSQQFAHLLSLFFSSSPSLLFVFRVNNLNSNYVTASQRKMIINALCLRERLHCAVCRSLKTGNFSPFKADLPKSTQEAFWAAFSVVTISCTYTSASISASRLRGSHKGSHSFLNSA